jgi:xanthine dehydrogenase YagS FAD-binding subunit
VKPFAYQRPADADAAVAAVAGRPGARFLAGGTNLVDLMKLGVDDPDLLVDVSRLALDAIQVSADGTVHIGAGVRNSDLAAHPHVCRRFPVLSQALLDGASGQLRNLATVGGNLLQRTRCRYFQDPTKPCNKRSAGTGCPAIHGEHRNLAVLGASDACVATHPSDMAVALVALDAVVDVQGADGSRSMPVRDLHRLPGDEPWRDTVLEHADLITAVRLPPLHPGARSAYRKARDRASFAFAVGSVAAVIDVADGVVADVRLGLGAVAHRPWRAVVAEDALRGGPATEEAFRAAADAELARARPLRDNGYKVALVRNLIVRTLVDLTAPGASS